MGKLVINKEKLTPSIIKELVDICPFGAMESKDGGLEINAACKMCKLCVKKGPKGVVEFIEDKVEEIDKSLWKGIAVYVDHVEGNIHPVTYELIGKAKELAAKISDDYPVYAVFVGHNIKDKAQEILHYGVDEVFVYDYEELYSTGHEKKYRSRTDKTCFWWQYNGSDIKSKSQTSIGYRKI